MNSSKVSLRTWITLITAFHCGASIRAQDWTISYASNENWVAVTCSADGTKMAAAANGGPISISVDSGVTWSRTSAQLTNWVSVASSSDGTKYVAAVSGGPIFLSTNSGMTRATSSAPLTNWMSVASSADGARLIGSVGRFLR